MSTVPVSGSLLDAVEQEFVALADGRPPLCLPASAVRGLPDRRLPVGELRARLLHPSTPHATRDAALGLLVTRARTLTS